MDAYREWISIVLHPGVSILQGKRKLKVEIVAKIQANSIYTPVHSKFIDTRKRNAECDIEPPGNKDLYKTLWCLWGLWRLLFNHIQIWKTHLIIHKKSYSYGGQKFSPSKSPTPPTCSHVVATVDDLLGQTATQGDTHAILQELLGIQAFVRRWRETDPIRSWDGPLMMWWRSSSFFRRSVPQQKISSWGWSLVTFLFEFVFVKCVWGRNLVGLGCWVFLGSNWTSEFGTFSTFWTFSLCFWMKISALLEGWPSKMELVPGCSS